MTQKQIWLHLGGLIVLIGALGLFYWQSTGARAVPALIESLRDEDPAVRSAGALALEEIGPDAHAAAPALLNQALHDSVQYARTTAAGALKTTDLASARKAMAAAQTELAVPDVQTRRDACALLGSLGPVAKPAVPDLVKRLDDPDEIVRMLAVGSLGEIGLPATQVIPALDRALRDPSPVVRHRAVSHFAFSVTPTEDVLPRLKELVNDKDRGVGGLAQSALNSPHRQSKTRVDTFVMMLRMGSGQDYTLRQLAMLGPEAAPAVPALIPLLNDRSALRRYLTAETLGAIGPGAKEALPALTAVSRDEDPVVRESAAWAVTAIGGSPQP